MHQLLREHKTVVKSKTHARQNEKTFSESTFLLLSIGEFEINRIKEIPKFIQLHSSYHIEMRALHTDVFICLWLHVKFISNLMANH